MIGDISRFPSAKKLDWERVSTAAVNSIRRNQSLRQRRAQRQGRKELRWAMVEASWGAIRSDPYWKRKMLFGYPPLAFYMRNMLLEQQFPM